MNTSVINIKTNKEVKQQAQQVGKNLGVSLSALINGYLHQLIRLKKVEFSMDEEPSEYLKQAIKNAKEQRKRGKASPIFDNTEDMLEFLHKQTA